MTFALESRGAALWVVLCSALGSVGCAEGVAIKEPFEGAIDNGSSADTDSATQGADAADGSTSAPSGGADANSTGGATTGGTTGTGASTSNGDAGRMPVVDAGVQKDAGTSCQPGTTQCGTLCVDLKSSASNCGRCGHPCPGGQACNGAGLCLAPANCTFLTFESHDYFACSATKEWQDARSACVGWSMDLPIVETVKENDFLKARPGWLAYNDITAEKTWLWVKTGGAVNGPAATYTNWDAPKEPNNDTSCGFLCTNSKGEDCGEIRSDGTWNDARCDSTRSFLCETY